MSLEELYGGWVDVSDRLRRVGTTRVTKFDETRTIGDGERVKF